MITPENQTAALQGCYDNLSKLHFNNLLILQAQLAEHIHNVWQHASLRKEMDESGNGPY